ncbi:MAG: hypothetical protein U0939_09775 [Pirellulales bacterium]
MFDPMLEREEYVEQAHFFRTVSERLSDDVPLQDLLQQVREELLATTRLPLAISFLLDELKHAGSLHTAMARLAHYFAPFQTFVMRMAESDRGRFDHQVALEVLRFEAEYRAQGATAQGLFLYQFETLCRNRLRYDHGLAAIAADPQFDAAWRDWILSVRRRLGMVDLADMIYVCSEHYRQRQEADPEKYSEPLPAPLFGEKEGRIALANRRKDPLYLFSALQRHLGYPAIPRRRKQQDEAKLTQLLQRRIDQLEMRVKLLEEDQRGGFDLAQFYSPATGAAGSLVIPPPPDDSKERS